MPRGRERFENYLYRLQQGDKNDLRLPIMGYNPMAKEHVPQKIEALLAMDAESIMAEVLVSVNEKCPPSKGPEIKVVLNLADDLHGGWTNRHTTDFDSKFKHAPLVRRHFCTPYCWTGETHSPQLIRERTEAYALRTWHHLEHPKIKTLADHLRQEVFVQSTTSHRSSLPSTEGLAEIELFYQRHQDSDLYPLIFNFFYGDEASRSLGYSTYGIGPFTGFDFARYLANATP